MQEEMEYRHGDFHRRAKQCHALDAHSFASKPRDRAKEAHDRRKQKMLDTYEAYVLEVKGAQQALGEGQEWVDRRLNEAKQELTQAQGVLERFWRRQWYWPPTGSLAPRLRERLSGRRRGRPRGSW